MKNVWIKSHPEITRNTETTTYPRGELKYEFSSFFVIVRILFIGFLIYLTSCVAVCHSELDSESLLI